MNLHSITASLVKLAWYAPHGGNGQVAGPGRLSHLYRVERGVPSPILDDHNQYNYRRYWQPYNFNDTNPRIPLCGELRTTANYLELDQWERGAYHRCADCSAEADRLGLPASTVNILQAVDPWNGIPVAVKAFTLDPVSGR